MFLHVSVILFTGGLPHCMLGYTPPGTRGRYPPQGPGTPQSRHPRDQRQAPPPRPQDQVPPWEQTPPGTRHPPVQCMLGDTGNKQEVCILLECNLVIEIVTASKRSCGKVMLLHVSLILSAGGWE